MRYIAFFDILGFKDLVFNNDHEALEGIYEHFSKAAHLSLANFQAQEGQIADNSISDVDMSKATVNSLIVSDSVIFWTDSDSPNDFIEIIHASQLMLAISFKIGVPVRGGISFGDFTFNEVRTNSPQRNVLTSCFGKALVEAYSIEALQEWSGCIVNQIALDHFSTRVEHYQKMTQEKLVNLDLLKNYKMLVEYEAPLKKPVKNYLVVNYLNHSDIDMGFTEQRIRSSFSAFSKSTTPESVQTKINNTISFFKYATDNAWVGTSSI
ncbi:TPA: hypothetical protein ACF3XD_004549 [Vibrio parahaemolyticus]|nr:hypothetical protein [Vibrio parahaemolyticus]HCH6204044.1 hypothetical protein [Vibrio parahaemolyticus]